MNFSAGTVWDNKKLSYLILILFTILLYSRSIQYGFVLDDTIVYDENKFVDKGFGGIWDILSTESFTGYFGKQQDYVAGARYRPLSIVSFAIEKQIFGKSPRVAHLINILLYAFCGILIFGFLKRLIKNETWQKYIPFIGALLFLAHPIHTEAVANIKGRDEIMCMLFSILSLNTILDYYDSRESKKLVLSVFYYFLALMSKENAITFLLIIPLTLVFFRKEKFFSAIKMSWMIWIPAILFLVIRTKVIGYFLNNGGVITDLMNNPFVGMRIDEKISTIIYCIAWYIKLLFIPHPLTHDYYPYHVPKIGFEDGLSWLGFITVFGMSLILFIYRKRFPVIWYAFLFFVISISIVSNIVFPVGTFMNERFLFIPSIAFVLVLCYWTELFLNRKLIWKNYIFSFLGLIVVLYSIRTFTRIPDWRTGDSLNFAAIEISKNSARINLFTGVSYFHMAEAESQPEIKKKYLDESSRYIDKALFIYPDYEQGLNMKAGILAEYHKLNGGTEDFLIHLMKVVERKPNLKFVHDYLNYLKNEPKNKYLLYDYYLNTGYYIFFKKKAFYDPAIEYLEEAYKIRRNEKFLMDKMIEVYSIVSYSKGISVKKSEELKARLADLKLFYQMTLK
ncbi:MAG: hypothetical protein ABI851_00290 [Saprospiraceae bacterium]